MIPVVDEYLEHVEVQKQQPSRAWKITDRRMAGWIDGVDAVRQAAWKMLNTEQGIYDIYSDAYGLQTMDLTGREIGYAATKLKQRVAAALMRDDRISNVAGFMTELDERKLKLSFTVASIFGDFEMVLEVRI